MCKVTIHEVKKAKKPVNSPPGVKPWTLFIMECVISVDANTKTDVRTVKTFEQDIYQQINTMQAGTTLTFEADKKPDGSVYEYTLKKDRQANGFRNRGGRNGSEPFGPTNRQAALKVAVELHRAKSKEQGEVPTAAQIIETAEELLCWLEGGAK